MHSRTEYRQYNGFKLMCLAAFTSFLLSGCFPKPAAQRYNQGFLDMLSCFNELKPTPELHEVIEMSNGLKIHIVGHSDTFEWDYARVPEHRILGYFNPEKNEIWVLGKEHRGKLIVNEATLGHEIIHYLGTICPKLADPDKFYRRSKTSPL